VERVDGGFLLRGRWSFSSGCDFCQWAVLGGTVPPTQEDAPPDVRSFLVPRSDYSIDDNWHVMGLCGTGSKDIVVEKAFVPEYRTLSYLDTFHLRHPGAAVNVHAIRAHAGNNPDKAALIFGRSEFGLPPQELRF
jgi:3-hydroxy-9,10-secoandrosta-1,3,5(10)-triene-9,17-dione monooxygenase